VREGDGGPDDCRGAAPGRGRRLGPTEATPAPVLDGAGGGDAVEPLRTGDDPTWRIRFAYFDSKGAAHEAANEFVVAAWKPGDEGLAMFPPDQPDLATFRRLGSA
jgi:hypothetical protein